MIISRPLICLFWVLCLSVGIYEVAFTPLKEAGIVAIYMSLMGLLREYSSMKEKPDSVFCDDNDFIQTGKY